MSKMNKNARKAKGTDVGMLSVNAGMDNTPVITYADKIAGAKMKK